jgi:hypothetical protein
MLSPGDLFLDPIRPRVRLDAMTRPALRVLSVVQWRIVVLATATFAALC